MPPAPTRELLTTFDRLHLATFGTRAIIHAGKDAKHLARLWRTHAGELDAMMQSFFARRDPYVEHAGYSVGVFVSQAPKLLMALAARPKQADTGDWFTDCHTIHAGRCGGRMAHHIQLKIDRTKGDS